LIAIYMNTIKTTQTHAGKASVHRIVGNVTHNGAQRLALRLNIRSRN
jgi:hypothetical protein